MPNLIRPLLLLVALWAAADAMAQAPARDAAAARRERRSDAADSVRRVERETGGEVLRAEPMQRSGREVYRLKVLTPEGRVRVMQDDPHHRRERFRRPERAATAPPVVVEREPAPADND